MAGPFPCSRDLHGLLAMIGLPRSWGQTHDELEKQIRRGYQLCEEMEAGGVLQVIFGVGFLVGARNRRFQSDYQR